MKYLGWLTLILFIATCDSKEPCPLSSQCLLDPDPGFCRAIIKRYYYDKVAKQCKEFYWGGCDGVVPFETMEECQQCGCTKEDAS